MASMYQVMAALESQVTTAVSGLSPVPEVAIGWPAMNRLQQIGQGAATTAISIYDRKMGRNTTRWSPEVVAQTLVPATLTSAVGPLGYLTATRTTTITLGGSVTDGDAVSAVLARSLPGAAGATVAAAIVVGTGSDTPTTLATALAAATNADPVLSTWVTATVVGPVVTLAANFVNGTLGVQSYTGNGGTQTREIGRRERSIQLTAWTRTEEQRQAVVDAVTTLLANLDVNFGITAADGTTARMSYGNDFDLEDNTLQDVYRHDFLVTAEYAVTVQDRLYAVLAGIPTLDVDPVTDD